MQTSLTSKDGMMGTKTLWRSSLLADAWTFLDSCAPTQETQSDCGQPCAIRAQKHMNPYVVIFVGVATAIFHC